MSFVYPLGLLGLIGVPVLILVYIIKNQYTEKTIPSTYLWELSERFLKKRLPVSKLVGIISLILQILAVIFISLAIAHPVFSIPGAARNYLFILDGSGSMNYTDGEITRFEEGKNRIEEIIKSSMKGSRYTLLCASEETETVFSDIRDKDRALILLEDVKSGYGDGKEGNNALGGPLSDAIGKAQEFYSADTSAKVYVFTDISFQGGTFNIEVVNVANGSDNYGISDLTVERETRTVEAPATGTSSSTTYLVVKGKVTAYSKGKTLEVGIYVGGDDTPFATQEVTVGDMATVDFTVEHQISEMLRGSVETRLEIEDDLPLDNSVIHYDIDHENSSRVLIVSDTPFFMQAALIAAGTSQITVKSPDDYNPSESGYDMFLFERFVPSSLPEHGAVWFVNPQSSVEGSNFTNQGVPADIPREGAVFAKATSNMVKTLLGEIGKEGNDDLKNKEFDLKQYVKCGLGGKFYTVMTCEQNPILFAGTTERGNREVVFAFDPKDSAEFVLSAQFKILVGNLLDYTFPSALNEVNYTCGDTVTVNVVTGCTSMRIVSPSGNESFPDTNVASVEYTLGEVGTYKVEMAMTDGTTRTLNVFSALSEAERAPSVSKEEGLYLLGDAAESTTDGIYDDLLYLFIILAVIAAADYGVYCYEQYQLR